MRTQPSNLTTFSWKLMHHALEVDRRTRSKGVQLTSICKCCAQGNAGSITHLFLHSEVASSVLNCFGSIFHLPYQFVSVAQALAVWSSLPSNPSQFVICKASIVRWIFRELWILRCAAVYEGTLMVARRIAIKIILWVQLQSLVFALRKSSTMIQRHILGSLC